MKNYDKEDIIEFYKGKLSLDKILEIDNAIQNDSNLKFQAQKYILSQDFVAELADSISGLYECPDYEILSGFVENSLPYKDAKKVASHINMCEYCYNGVNRLQDLRAQAQLREPIEVKISKPAKQNDNREFWKRFAIGSSMLAFTIILGLFAVLNEPITDKKSDTTIQLAETPKEITTTEKNINTSEPKKSLKALKEPTEKPNITVANKSDEKNYNNKIQIDTPASLFEDGKYAIRRNKDQFVITKKDSAEKVSISDKIIKAINDKLASGRISNNPFPQLAVIAHSLRDESSTNISPVAPKPISPKGIVVISNNPEINWSEVDLAESYNLIITDSDGKQVYNAITKENSHVLNTKLKRGDIYTWRVGVRFGETSDWNYSQAVKFKVLSDEGYNDIISIKKQIPNSHLALGVVYEMYGLTNEANEEYNKLISKDSRAKAYIK